MKNKVLAAVKKQYKESQNEKFICNGKFFSSFGAVENYANSLGFRISNTETIRKGTYLITLS